MPFGGLECLLRGRHAVWGVGMLLEGWGGERGGAGVDVLFGGNVNVMLVGNWGGGGGVECSSSLSPF